MATEKQSIDKPRYPTTLVALWIIVIFLIGALIYVLTLNRTLQNAGAASTGIDNPVALVNEISDMIILPEDETPTVARIDNAVKIQQTNPDFYRDVEDGDILIVFTNKAIIYRPTLQKIVNVAPVIVNAGTSTQAQDTKFQDSSTTNEPDTSDLLKNIEDESIYSWGSELSQ